MDSCNVIHILIVEDSKDDAVLLLAELEKSDWIVRYQRVETETAFLAALKARRWDAVISDYVLPQFSGPEALKLFREQGLDIPFILVSGIYGEDKAVEMIKAGANDYILKENLPRVVPTLKRELEAAKERQALKRAQGAMQYLAAIVESSEDAIYGKNLDSIIVSWNPAAERLYGYSAEEIIGRSNAVLFPLNRRDELLDILANIRRGEMIGFQETERCNKNGKIVPVSVTISPIKNAKGEVIGASSISRDISKQKQAEEDRQQLLEELLTASKQVQSLSGLLPICACCKRIRDDKGYWQQVETYISKYTEAVFSHGICPECVVEYERQFDYKEKTVVSLPADQPPHTVPQA